MLTRKAAITAAFFLAHRCAADNEKVEAGNSTGASQRLMRRVGRVARVLLLLALAAPLAAATPGIFEGTIYETDQPKLPAGWILVQARNGSLRKVEISRARIVYAQSVPGKDRAQEPHGALVHGTRVRVTAEQDSSGEWRAIEVEILRLNKERRGSAASVLSQLRRKCHLGAAADNPECRDNQSSHFPRLIT